MWQTSSNETLYDTLQASKAASVASKKTKEFGQTVNESVIKPTKDKVGYPFEIICYCILHCIICCCTVHCYRIFKITFFYVVVLLYHPFHGSQFGKLVQIYSFLNFVYFYFWFFCLAHVYHRFKWAFLIIWSLVVLNFAYPWLLFQNHCQFQPNLVHNILHIFHQMKAKPFPKGDN